MKITLDHPVPVTPPALVTITLTQEEASTLAHLAFCATVNSRCMRAVALHQLMIQMSRRLEEIGQGLHWGHDAKGHCHECDRLSSGGSEV